MHLTEPAFKDSKARAPFGRSPANGAALPAVTCSLHDLHSIRAIPAAAAAETR